ncbi:MAG: ferredoxin [Polyangiales bacterium]
MKVAIDWDLCQGHANCTGDAPEVFHVDADGKLHVLIVEPPEALREGVESAVKYCPTGAISIQD